MKKILQNGINDLEDAIQTRHVPSDMWQATREDILTFSNGETYEAHNAPESMRVTVASQN